MNAGVKSDWSATRRVQLGRAFRGQLRGEARFDIASRMLYATDASNYRIEPLGVVLPRDTTDVATTLAIAREQGASLVPRGGGTSLSGQSVGSGLVVDFSKYLHRVLEIDAEQLWAQVEPGVVLGQLNKQLRPLGLQFGPDVATSDRANLGGMIGNNSAGARSLVYGKTIDHVLALDVLLADGTPTTLGAWSEETVARCSQRRDLLGDACRVARRVVTENADAIRARYPKVLRRVSGYNLDALLPPQPFDLSKLIVGSEGTLAVILAAKLRLLPLPARRALAVVHYDSLDDALFSLPAILTTSPSAVELIDQWILDLARASPVYRERIDFLIGTPQAVFLVEYSADSDAEIDIRFAALDDALRGLRHGPILPTRDEKRREYIWSVRKTAMPLLLGMPGERKPVTFVEDTAVAPERLPEFVSRFRDILRRYQTTGSFYGHASVGCLHIRPFLDLRSKTGVKDMEAIAHEVVELVLEFGGALSGEHGDGLCRGYFNPRLFGQKIYQGFIRIKKAFDPHGLLNPGKIVESPPITENLRYAPQVEGSKNHLLPEGSVRVLHSGVDLAEMARGCNGNGLCRRVDTGVMCPSYMATREEEHSTRGRANLLLAAIEGRLSTDTPAGTKFAGHSQKGGDWAVPELGPALDLCLMCKACKTECPSHVDIAKVKVEYLWRRRGGRPATWRDQLLGDVARLGKIGASWVPWSNWLLRSWPVRWWLDRFLGIDARRPLPLYAPRRLSTWFRDHVSICRKPRGRVVLLADCFTDLHQPHVGEMAVKLLEAAGYAVHLAPVCCGRALLSKGFVDEALALARSAAPILESYVNEGMPILGLEPSCLATLRDEWRDLLPGAMTERVAQASSLVETWLAERQTAGACDLPQAPAERFFALYHGHCHQRADGALDGSTRAIDQLAGVDLRVLDSGCCGMAGSFGYEKAHYAVSVAIAEQRLLPALRAAPTATVVAPGFSCRSQIADLANRAALHPVELIHQRLFAESHAIREPDG